MEGKEEKRENVSTGHLQSCRSDPDGNLMCDSLTTERGDKEVADEQSHTDTDSAKLGSDASYLSLFSIETCLNVCSDAFESPVSIS